MQYRLSSLSKTASSDLASGHVLFGLPGFPSLPIRLADEIFLRCMELRKGAPCDLLMDPCCGTGYHLAVLGFLHPGVIRRIQASDIDSRAVERSRQNLALLDPDGLRDRRGELAKAARMWGKESHQQSVLSADRLLELPPGYKPPVVDVAAGDATNPADLLRLCGTDRPSVILADVPYGRQSVWKGPGNDHLTRMLESFKAVAGPATIIAVISGKSPKPVHDAFLRRDLLRAGHRLVTIFSVKG